MTLALGIYGLVWYLPNRAELTRVNHFYMFAQLIPRDPAEVRLLLTRAFLGDEMGYSSYLVRHAPVQFVCTLLGIAAWALRRGKIGLRPGERRNALFLGLWLLIFLTTFSVVRYTPSRYYVLFYPALTGLAAVVLGHIETIARTVWRHRPTRTALGGFLTYHLAEAGLHHKSNTTEFVLYSAVLLVCTALILAPTDRKSGQAQRAGRLPTVMFAAWALLNTLWLGDWLAHLTYLQREADRWLAATLPPDSILIGDAAPGLCLNNGFVAVCVIPGLCNDEYPLETFASHPRYVVILDGERNTDWWRYYYPDVIRPERVKRFFPHLINFSVTVYEVPADVAQPSAPLRKP